MARRIYDILPPIVTGYEIRGKDALLSIITPEASVNLCRNPSFERGIDFWAAVEVSGGGASTEEQYSGAWSFKVIPNANPYSYAQTVITGLVSGQTYTFSLYIKTAPGIPFKAYIQKNVGGPIENTTTFLGRGVWQRVWVNFTASSSGDYQCTVGKNNSTSLAPFYIDAVQFENKTYATTYFDGDTKGLIATRADYLWTGAPHASTSIRTAQARNGGRVHNFDEFLFSLMSIRGLGKSPNYNAVTASGFKGNSYYQTTVDQERIIQLTGRLDADSPAALASARQAFGEAVSHHLTVPPQQLTLLYQRTACDGAPPGPVLELLCTYDGGLEGTTESDYSEVATPQFTMQDPALTREQSAGIELVTSGTITDADYILERLGLTGTQPGAWTSLDQGLVGGRVAAMGYGPDGLLYVVGLFTSAFGVANTAYVATWNDTTRAWASITPTPADGSIRCLAFDSDGTLYVGGTFANINGVAAAAVASYSGGVWSALGAGLDNSCLGMTIGFDGTLYVTGTFANAGGAAAAGVAQWNGAAWSAMGSGLSAGQGQAMATGLDGLIYVTGSFSTADGNTVNHITYWDGTTFQPMGTGLAGGTPAGAGLAIGLDGRVYLAGNFTSANGVSINGIGYWDGLAWYAMGTGVSGGAAEGQKVFVDPMTGMVYLGGSWITIDGIATPDSAARWNGSAWTPLDVNLPGTATLYAVAVAADGTIVLGFDQTGSATGASAINYAVNTGNTDVYPIMELAATGPLYSIRNVTTGAEIFFNLTLLPGERLHLEFDPAAIIVTSTFRGDVSRLVLPGSQLSNFFLMPGTNSLAVFLQESATVQNMLWWQPRYLSVDVAS